MTRSLDGDLARVSDELSTARTLRDLTDLVWHHERWLNALSARDREVLMSTIQDRARAITEEHEIRLIGE
jgi:hypothetical protein